MDYNSVRIKYDYKIRTYVNEIASSMKVTASTTGAKVITTTAYTTLGEDTALILENCMKDFYITLEKDYSDADSYDIEKMVQRIFDEDVIPNVKKINQGKMNTEMTKSYVGNAFEEIIGFAFFMGIIIFLLWVFGVIK